MKMMKTGMQTLKYTKGFTLLELMIAVAVLGILLAIAVPNYMEYVTKSRRAEAESDMLQIRLGLEKWRANNNSYSATLANADFTDNNDYYNYVIQKNSGGGAPDGSNYYIKATAQGVQATRDAACTPLSLDQSGIKGPAGCWKK